MGTGVLDVIGGPLNSDHDPVGNVMKKLGLVGGEADARGIAAPGCQVRSDHQWREGRMSRMIRSCCGVIAGLVLWSVVSVPATAQGESYNYGFCMGVAGVPPVNYLGRPFLRGSTNVDAVALFRRDLGEKHGSNVRIDATGCRFYATAAEVEAAHRQLMEQSKGMRSPFVTIDWVPPGGKALSPAAPAPGSKPDTQRTRKPQ
jgi:hypothetical protein